MLCGVIGNTAMLTTKADDSDVTVYAVLEKALNDLTDVCDAVEDKFTSARDEFNAANPDRGKA